MKNKNCKKIMIAGIFIVVSIIFTTSIKAATVNSSLSIPVDMTEGYANVAYLAFDDVLDSFNNTTAFINLNKNISIVDENNLNLSTVSNTSIGKILNVIVSTTDGNWNMSNKQQGLGGLFFSEDRTTYHSIVTEETVRAQVFTPEDNNIDVMVSSDNPNVIECVNLVCTTKQNGLANITVSFKNKIHIGSTSDTMTHMLSLDQYGLDGQFYTTYWPVSTKGSTFYGSDNSFGKIKIGLNARRYHNGDSKSSNNLKNMTYSFPPVTYAITVGSTNTPQTTTCAGATNISTSTATVNWTYADGDNDLQSNYQVQIATNPTFDTASIFDSILAPANTDVSNIRSVNVSGLSQNTNYYSRVRTYNNTNGWSEYSGCVNSFLTTYDTTNTVCGCEGRDSVCRTSGNIISTTSNAPQCQFDTACSVSNDTSGNTIFRIIPINGIGNSAGNIEYIKDGVTSLIIKSNSYVYSTPTINAIQLITVIAKDLFDNQTKTRTCSIDNTITPTDEPPTPGDEPETPTIKLTKIPRITLNKNGTCTISWDIQNISAPSVCSITGRSGNIDLTTDSQGSYISGPLTSNTRFTLTCSGGELVSSVSESVICRVNPEIREN